MHPLDLKFRLEEVPLEGRAFEGVLEEDAVRDAVRGLAGNLGYRTNGPATIEGSVYRTSGTDVFVKGTLQVSVQFDCARCLERRTLNARTVVDHMLIKREKPKVPSEDNELLVSDDLLDEPDIEGYDGDRVDLTDLIREDVVLAMPMNPTCDDVEGVECAPLADQQPPEATIDPRWAPLLELKKKMN